MLNQITVVGELNEAPITKEIGNRKLTLMHLKCQRNYANSNGIYENDIIPITVWKAISEMALEKLQCGDVIAVSGRIQSRSLETKEGKPFTSLEVIGEKVSFITGA